MISATRRIGFELDIQDVRDGTYQLAVQVNDDGRDLGTATLLSRQKGARHSGHASRSRREEAPPAVRDDILFPVDRMKQINRGRLELRTFDPDSDFVTAEAVAASATSGRNAFVGKTGDFKRQYLLESAGEIMPYRLYVPSYLQRHEAVSAIVALHGLGGTEDAFFSDYDQKMPPLAERHGYIVAAPLGYRVDGSYGWGPEIRRPIRHAPRPGKQRDVTSCRCCRS